MKKTFGIIGYGKLGKTLADKLHSEGSLAWICSATSCDFAFDDIPCYKSIQEIEQPADVIFITKADKYIEESASQLAGKFKKQLKGKVIIHCSGIHGKNILDKCKSAGAITASAHPYQTFFSSNPGDLNGIYWACDAGANFDIISDIIHSFNGTAINTVELPGFNNAIYHASAVIASNYMNTIIALAEQAAKISGIKPEEFLPAILRTTLENNIKSLTQQAGMPLTGPIVRGDVRTIEKHIESLKQHRILLNEYCRIGLSTTELAYKNKQIDSDTYSILKTLFSGKIS